MPVPKRKRSRARKNKRFANKGLLVHAIVHCHNCQTPLKPHQACTGCGFYKGVKVVSTKADRITKRVEARKAEEQYQSQASAESTEQ